MKIAYVTPYDAHDPNAWSGAGYQIPRALASAGAEIVNIGSLRKAPDAPALVRALWARLGGNLHQLEREPSVVRSYSEQASRRLRELDVDLVLSPGAIAVTYLKTQVPKIIWTDTSFGGIVDYYPEFDKMTARNRRDGDMLERISLKACDLAVFTSDWAAKRAISLYALEPSNVRVIPFGSNFSSGLGESTVRSLSVDRLRCDEIRLLFVGVAWERKNGEFALAVTENLRSRGVKAFIDIIGCRPGAKREWATEYGFLSSSDESQASTVRTCFARATFLIHPAVAECNANVFSEACSFGVPILANKTGGIPTSVLPGVNGNLFALDDSPEVWADYIVNTLRERDKYLRLCVGAFQQYSTRLNWSAAGSAMLEVMKRLVSTYRPHANDAPVARVVTSLG
ncbi:glycosyltransferase family 4 protein [Paraburkholderia phymatum]|uniref:glycosyltransferase family 4 protein n=1 Tax=Paraburkholderia phymatum TaxID=148447 RepID=UPI00316ED2C2